MSITLAVWMLAGTTLPLYSQESNAATEVDDPVVPVEVDESEYRFGATEGGGEGAANAEGNGPIGAFGIWDLLRMVLVLLMVVGAVYGVVAFLRRRVPAAASRDDSPIRILASRDLSPNSSIYVVMIGRQVMVLGGGDSSIQLITTMDDQETIDELVLAASAAGAAAGAGERQTFGAVLGKWLGNAAIPGTHKKTGNSPADGRNNGEAHQIRSFLQVQQERLRKMR